MRLAPVIAALVIPSAGLLAQAAPAAPVQGPMKLYPAGTLQWVPGSPAMPKGIQMAVLEGDPAKPGMFTMRLKFPAGTRVGPHFHSQTEHATVIYGALRLGMGEKFDSAKTERLTTGSFGYWVAGTRHFAFFEAETVLQLHGQGPWTITYVNPKDDPRNQKP